ncbi:MAG: glycosyltransferase family 2 protein [Flavobacteriales bacterium]|nr:glycosyltransferase family 2 protein [Flavobacteriales bacterium]
MTKISATIITKNEEESIERCILSLKKVADEIIVIDSYSTDDTEIICNNLNVKFFKNKFEGHIQQKNFAISKAENDYILSLDADEALSERLIEEILLLKSNMKYQAYKINRLNNYMGKWIKFTDWNPDWKIRLFDKNIAEWGGMNPHDFVILNKTIKVEKLKHRIRHWVIEDIETHSRKANQFSTIGAQSYYDKGIKSNYFKITFNPSWSFLKSYFLKLGFLDGIEGLSIAAISSYTVFLKYLKLYQIQNKRGKAYSNYIEKANNIEEKK